MPETGNTPIVRNIANEINLYSGREGLKTAIPYTIQPTIDVREIGDLTGVYDTESISSSGNKHMFTVPEKEFWTLYYSHIYVYSGTFTIGGIKLFPKTGWNRHLNNNSEDPEKWLQTTGNMYFWYYEAGSNPLIVDTNKGATPVRLPGGWTVYSYIDSYSVSGAMDHYSIIRREIY